MSTIDIHGHFGVYDVGAGPGALANRLYGGEIEVVSARAKAAGIGLTVVSALRALFPYGGDPLRGNDDARMAAERQTGIRFWAVLNPRIKATYGQVEVLLRHPRCTGIKLHPQRHCYEIRHHGDELFSFAATHRALVLTHSGDPGSFPEDFIPFANSYPEVRVILAHLGNSSDGVATRQVAAIKQSQANNVYVDTSSSRSMVGNLIEWAVEEIGADRLLFGTDTPLYSAACQKARIDTAEIPEEAKRAILFGNANRLLGEPVEDGA